MAQAGQAEQEGECGRWLHGGHWSGLAWSWAARGRRAASAGVCGEERLVLCLLVVVVVVVAWGFVSLRIDRLMAGWLVSFHLLLLLSRGKRKEKLASWSERGLSGLDRS